MVSNAIELDRTRVLLDILSDRWTVPALGALCDSGGAARFNALRRALPAVSQKSLAACLRRLEMNGLVERHVFTKGRLAVEYRVTQLGHSIEAPVLALVAWSEQFGDQVDAARSRYREDALTA
ncbi:hypothetical protein TM49_09300 [Martelella endophytica]|uniref:HTH hxlR-type domain-containing protein n=1 Tax=Martelella endophytica TaxID=1486262 RepID=A0A0D5LVN3_MAREN|nr:hypothetical protein TM49_09300 [Martelella endophytica]